MVVTTPIWGRTRLERPFEWDALAVHGCGDLQDAEVIPGTNTRMRVQARKWAIPIVGAFAAGLGLMEHRRDALFWWSFCHSCPSPQ